MKLGPLGIRPKEKSKRSYAGAKRTNTGVIIGYRHEEEKREVSPLTPYRKGGNKKRFISGGGRRKFMTFIKKLLERSERKRKG